MRPVIFLVTTLGFLGGLFCPVQTQAQTVRYVDNIASCDGLTPCYSTIMDAVNAAAPSDTIEVFPGLYQEAVVFSSSSSSKANITLKAHVEALMPVIAPPAGQDAVYVEATGGVRLLNLVLETPDANGVRAVGGASSGLVVDGNLLTAKGAINTLAVGRCTVTNNRILHGDISGDFTACVIEGNTVAGGIALGDLLFHPSGNSVRHNVVRGGTISIGGRAAAQNTIEDNFVSGGGGISVDLALCCSSNVIQDNTSIENRGCDIEESSPNHVHNTWQNNRFGTKCGTATD